MRLLKTFGIVIAVFVGAAFVSMAVDSDPLSDGSAGRAASALTVIGFLVWALPKVAYRKRDALLAFIPFYGFFLLVMASWRLASLPIIAWPLRPEDQTSISDADEL